LGDFDGTTSEQFRMVAVSSPEAGNLAAINFNNHGETNLSLQ
jgi:hypothetical protein